jgi:hypothetical protein
VGELQHRYGIDSEGILKRMEELGI